MSTLEIMAPLQADMEKVNGVIRTRLNSDVVLIRTIGEYLINAGGKRMRPALVLMVANALGYQGDLHHLMAATVEFIHTSTLLHDDVVDESELRRGRSTANAMFGNAASVLVGDYLYSRSFEMMVDVGQMRIMEIMSQATTVIAEGEVLQLLNVHDPHITIERYMQVIHYKTAKLFEASAQVGAVLSGASPEVEAAASAFGRHFGAAFQLVDDLLDYAGDAETLGKNVGDDLREGKATLPLIRAMQVGTPEQKAIIQHAIENGHGDFAQIAGLIQETDALQYTAQAARQEVESAIAQLAHFPDNLWSQMMKQLAQYSLKRLS